MCILHCILNYPTSDQNANLAMISSLKKSFPSLLVGYSDHTIPTDDMLTLSAAYMLGATIIEKHFTDDKSKKGNDHYHAMDKNDLNVLRNNLKKIDLLMGKASHKMPLDSEKISIENARRSLVLARDITSGEVINSESLICKRPGTGISPVYLELVLGKRASRNLKVDHILTWPDLY